MFGKAEAVRFDVLLVLLLLALPISELKAQRCGHVVNGIDHCPVGNSALSVQGNTVIAKTGGGPGDGLRSIFQEAQTWTARNVHFVETSSVTSDVTLSSVAGYEVSSTASIHIRPDRQTFLLTFESLFYDVEIYRNGALVALHAGVASGAVGLNAHLPGVGGSSSIIVIDLLEFIVAENDVCQWVLAFGSRSVPFTFPTGEVVHGDRVRFVETPESGHGHMNTFTGMGLAGSVELITMADEEVSSIPGGRPPGG